MHPAQSPSILSLQDELPAARTVDTEVPSVLRWATKGKGKRGGLQGRSIVTERADSTAELVAKMLDVSEADFRTVSSLALETALEEGDVRLALKRLGPRVRQPVQARGMEIDWYRLTARGLTTQEKIRYVLLVLSRTGR